MARANAAKPAEQEKFYDLSFTKDGVTYDRRVTVKGLPWWTPQKPERGHPQSVAGEIVDRFQIPASAGFEEREAFLLRAVKGGETTYWVVPMGAAIARQVGEMNVAIGHTVHISYEGKGKPKDGRQAANRFALAVARPS